MRASTRPPSAAAIVGWGLFCACSWTWVIGMYLPRIMGERYGWTGLLVFAIPNVLGCAAFGWVIRSAAASRRYAAVHARLLAWFAAATVGFHLLFFAWLGGSLAFGASAVGPTSGDRVAEVAADDGAATGAGPGPAAGASAIDGDAGARRGLRGGVTARRPVANGAGADDTAADDAADDAGPASRRPGGLAWLPFALPAGLLAAGLLLSRLRDEVWPHLATVLWGTSLAIGAWLLVRPGGASTIGAIPAGLLDPDPWLLAPIVAAGFLLCPYPDPTFHRARQACDTPLVFGVFGLGFACMLGVTLAVWFRDPAAVTLLAFVHLALQATFTVGAHLRELRERLPADARHVVLPVLPALLFASVLAADPAAPATGGTGLASGEANYLRYMALYGLVFPALVLFLAPPRRLPVALAPLGPRTLAIALVVLAVPCELAFIHGWEWLGLVPVAALVAWAVRSRGDADDGPRTGRAHDDLRTDDAAAAMAAAARAEAASSAMPPPAKDADAASPPHGATSAGDAMRRDEDDDAAASPDRTPPSA